MRVASESSRRDNCDIRASRYERLLLAWRHGHSGIPSLGDLESLILFASHLRLASAVCSIPPQTENMYGKVSQSVNELTKTINTPLLN